MKPAFSLVEVIAALVILGMLSLALVPLVREFGRSPTGVRQSPGAFQKFVNSVHPSGTSDLVQLGDQKRLVWDGPNGPTLATARVVLVADGRTWLCYSDPTGSTLRCRFEKPSPAISGASR